MIKKLKVNSSIYDISYIKDLKDCRNGNIFGYIKHGPKTIEIEKNISKETQLQTILHEGVHGILVEHCFEQRDDEEFTERISNAIYALMIDNKKFIREIITEE